MVEQERFLAVAKVLKAHGLEGAVQVKVLTDFPERLRAGGRVFAAGQEAAGDRGSGWEPEEPPGVLEIGEVRENGDRFLLRFSEIKTRQAATALKGCYLLVKEEDAAQLPEDHFWEHQIVGLDVVGVDGEAIGTVEEVLRTGANDVYALRTRDGRELLVPATKQVIKEVDLAARRLIIDPLPGLFD